MSNEFAHATTQDTADAVKRPSRWALSNWPVGWKVLAIALVPLVLAGVLGGLRISSGLGAAADLRRAADRADLVPAIVDYMAALDTALLATSTDTDVQSALGAFDASRKTLADKLAGTDAVPDVEKGVTTILQGGRQLLDGVTSNAIGLRDRITTYAPILLTAEDAINGSVRVDDERIRAETVGLSRAVGARGQMTMQQLLVNRGADLPEPELRTSMITLAGTEPSTLFGMSQVLGVGSADAQKLQEQMVRRMGMMSDPAIPLPNNADLAQSIQATNEIAGKIIADTSASITAAVHGQADHQRSTAIRDAILVVGAILVALIAVALVARSLVRPLRRLRDGALKVAHQDLARELEQVRAGGDPGPIRPLPVPTTEEVGQVAHAVDELHEQAVLLAAEQARLQLQVTDMFETLSRRSRSLVDQQLVLIDQLERDEADPQRLQSLFQLDHLAARMRRNGANLLVLSGTRLSREQSGPVALAAVVNAAASEVEDYTRVATAALPDTDINGAVAADLVHVVAELLDNALRYSPPATHVRVSAVRTGDGALVIEVGDEGLGMTEADLRVANTRLQSGGEINPYTARHMGLFVIGRLADTHGLVVRLRSTVAGDPSSGITAGIYVPQNLLVGDVGSVPVTDFAPAPPTSVVPPVLDRPVEPAADLVRPVLPAPDFDSSLPQRNPGASGIAGGPEIGPTAQPPEKPPEKPAEKPADTSAFFAARAQVRDDPKPHTEPVTGSDDAIYQKMLSEWLVDPTDLGSSADLDWKSVWDNGWSAAAAAEDTPVAEHTPEGLPVRQPGARLVPGAGGDPLASEPAGDDFDTGPLPDPATVRASISSHFGGVHAGRTHARETGGFE
ncbi:signal transduction histidine kinase [Mycolicibacterium canariasense]|uniref:histidine kinase n=1 Tax=Mycolicibacterium canariasense TaxID=228230 RepID=A0A117IC88_MYCCR|nr:ATP-binding protein [Mycolicibacterium canariasense]MCV7208101.1 sensor histidine kinase [Mycolicibacterium canariasense]ORV09552.1 histidine kinase [Mycolicibacterium canariasense]GAS99155.1 signal transduction histidine kinase [Mycolicibacterium canariasense]